MCGRSRSGSGVRRFNLRRSPPESRLDWFGYRASKTSSAESCILKAVAERGLTPGLVGLADAKAEDEAATGTAFDLRAMCHNISNRDVPQHPERSRCRLDQNGPPREERTKSK